MAEGLQIFNASGQLVLDYTEPTCEIYGFSETVAEQSGSISDSRITTDSLLIPYSYRYVTPYAEGTANYQQAILYAILPDFQISNGSISWTYASRGSTGDAYVEVGFMYGGKTK